MTNPTPHGQVPEALRLAHIFDSPLPPEWPDMVAAAAELRRQHTRIAELESELEAVGAGGVSGPLMGIAAPPTAQAEGWRLVPVEPTQKMLFAAMNAFVAASASLGAFNAPDAAYRALLAAAPTHPTSSVVVEHG